MAAPAMSGLRKPSAASGTAATLGRMSLAGVIPAPGQDPRQLLRLAGAAEDASEHPIEAAIAALSPAWLAKPDAAGSASPSRAAAPGPPRWGYDGLIT